MSWAATVWVLVGVVTAATVVGFADGAHWTLTLVGAPRVHYAVALLALAAAAAALRRWLIVAVAALAMAVNLALVAPLWLGDPAEAAADAPTLDVVVFNAKTATDTDALVEWLAREQPDVAVVPSTTRALTTTIAARSELTPVLSPEETGDIDVMVFTATPPSAAIVPEWHAVVGGSRAVEAVVDLEGQLVRLLGLYPESPRTSARTDRRDQMLARTAEWVAAGSSSDQPTVIAGDLNAVPWSSALRRLRADAGLVDSLVGHGIQPSWPAPDAWVGVPLDHVLHTPDLTTVERELGPSFGSDHRLVRARLRHVPEGGDTDR